MLLKKSAAAAAAAAAAALLLLLQVGTGHAAVAVSRGSNSSSSASSSSSSSSVKYSSPRKLGSIAFVVNTGSSEMQAELASLQRNIKQIQTRSRRFKNLLISFYGGGRKQQVQKSSSSKGVISFVQSASVAKTAKQCKQPAMTAIAESVLAADRNSIVIHITDAAASDSEKKGFAACLARYKNTRVFTVVTGSLCATNNADDYEDVAAQTRGAVLRIDEMFIDQVLEMIIEAEERIELFTTLGCFKPKRPATPSPTTPAPTTPAPTKPSKKCQTTLKCSCTGGGSTTINSTTGNGTKYEKGSISLGIILDSTGSMQPEYKQIYDGVEKLIKGSQSLFKNFILAEYNDPYEKRLAVATDIEQALDFLDEVQVNLGGDCPEPAFQGIYDVASAALPGSVLFVFTDASAKDLKFQKQTLDLLRRKDIVLNVISTGQMCKAEGKYNDALEKTAIASGGRQLKMGKNFVKFLLEYIQNFSQYGLEYLRILPESITKIKKVTRKCKCKKVKEC